MPRPMLNNDEQQNVVLRNNTHIHMMAGQGRAFTVCGYRSIKHKAQVAYPHELERMRHCTVCFKEKA